jgi:hypothetical protein
MRRHAPAAGLGSVIAMLLGLSLTHLAHGVRIVTGCSPYEANAMAVGLDGHHGGHQGLQAGFPLGQPRTADGVRLVVWAQCLRLLGGSSVLWMACVAAALAFSIPRLIYAATRSWAAVTIESRRAA